MCGKQSEVPKEGAYIDGMISKDVVPVGGICFERSAFCWALDAMEGCRCQMLTILC